MPTQYVKFTVEVTARVDCEEMQVDLGVPGCPSFTEVNPDTMKVSGIEIEDIPLDTGSDKVREYLIDLAADVALQKGEWQ